MSIVRQPSQAKHVKSEGAATATGAQAAIRVQAGMPVRVEIWGTFVGTIRVERSGDGGTTWLPLTVAGVAAATFTAPANERVDEENQEGAQWRLNVTGFTSGTINWRLSA